MKNLLTETKDTMRAIPGLVTALFLIACVSMNLLANKSIFNLPWLAATSGVFMSWVSFLCMDSVCKRFGSRAAVILNTVTMIINLLLAFLYMLICQIDGIWAASYAATSDEMFVAMNQAVNNTFSSSWYVVVGSALAMFLGGLTNSAVNKAVGAKYDHGGFKGFAIRSWISTVLGQLVDNLAFATFVSLIFFGWTVKQVIVCSFFMMIVELLFEVVFSPLGYKIAKTWKEEDVGREYLDKYHVEV